VFWAKFLDRQMSSEQVQPRLDDLVERKPVLAVYPLKSTKYNVN